MLYVLRWALYFIGLIIFSLGISLTINVRHLGLHAWDVLHVSLYDHFGLTIGTWSIILGMILVIICFFLDKSYIKLGTFLNILIVGMLVDFYLWLDFLPHATHTWTDIIIMLSGIVIMGLAGGMYNAGEVGAGPRDAFMLAISNKWGYSISKVRITVESTALIFGLILGGPIFIFTFIITFIQSPLFQFSYLNLNKMVKYLENKRLFEQSPEPIRMTKHN